jgi:hypothetical protein
MLQSVGLIEDDILLAIDVKKLLKQLAISLGLVKVTLSTKSELIWPLGLLRFKAWKRRFQVVFKLVTLRASSVVK